MTPRELAACIEQTLLRADATEADIARLCAEAVEFGFCGVCVNGLWVAEAARRTSGSGVKVVTVVGFPLGAMATRAKACEARAAAAAGANEIDMVLAIGLANSGRWLEVEEDIRAVVDAAAGAAVKVILETCLLAHDAKVAACRAAVAAGASFVKTSTGFSTGGATVEDVRLLRECVGRKLGVKASGGIRDRPTALALLAAGATRLGTSAGARIVSSGATGPPTGC